MTGGGIVVVVLAVFTKVKTWIAEWVERVPPGTRRAVQLAVAGGAVGLIGVTFHYAVEALHHQGLQRVLTGSTGRFLVGSFCLVVGASFLASFLIQRVAPMAGGGGVMPTKLAFWRDGGVISGRVALVKFVASVLTLGGGVSLGPEGPSVQVGAASASVLGRWMGIVQSARREFCAAGAGAAIAAAFNAPLAAILFVLEEIVGDLNSRLMSGILVASVMGALVAHALIGPQPAYQVAELGEASWLGYALVLPVALLATLVGIAFQRGAMTMRRETRARLGGVAPAYLPVVGAGVSWGCAVGAYFLTDKFSVFGIGYEGVTDALAGQLIWSTAAILLLAKLVATLFAVGTGGCGGVFAPSFYLGAMSGACVVAALSAHLSLTSSDGPTLVLVGMCACLGAVIRAPLTCVMLSFEVTHQFAIIPPVLLATLVSQLVARRLQPHGLYEEMLLQDGLNPARIFPPRDYKRWKEMELSAVIGNSVVALRLPLGSAWVEQVQRYRYRRFPVLAESGGLVGLVTREQALQAANGGKLPDLEAPIWVSPATPLGEAQRRVAESPSGFLCIGNPDTSEICGVMTAHDFLRAQGRLSDDAID